MMEIDNIINKYNNKKYGYMTVTSKCKRESGNLYFLCICDCGNEKWIYISNLCKTKSCGCKTKKMISQGNTQHGLYRHKLYSTWCNIKARCFNKNNTKYYMYGARGITVCNRWVNGDGITHPFLLFLQDMGDRPDGYSIDRIDFNGNYSPENCRWSNNDTQNKNKRTSLETYNSLIVENNKLKNRIKQLEEGIEDDIYW